MLTTTLDGLWALQVLSGVETLAPELGLPPILPRVESRHAALAHPVAAELTAAGVIDDTGVLDGAVLEWLTVLARREVGVVLHLLRPDGDAPARVVIARFARWWVVIERSADLIRIGGAGIASTAVTASAVLTAQIERLCGVLEPAPLRPVTLDAAALQAGATDSAALRDFLTRQRMDADQLELILLATDLQRSAQASIAAIQAGVATGRPTRTHIGPGTVTILDTPRGRLIAERLSWAGRAWVIVAPGTQTNITNAVDRVLCQLPAEKEWHSYRKAV